MKKIKKRLNNEKIKKTMKSEFETENGKLKINI